MPFKVKDLMINVAPGEPVGGWLSRFPCGCGCTYGYTVGCPNTGGGGTVHQTQFFARTWTNVIGGGGGHTENFGFNPDPVPWAVGAGGTVHCGCTYNFASYCQVGSGCVTGTAITPVFCPGATVIGPVPVPVGGDPAAASQQLAALKVQLQQALADLETQQEAVNASLQPQTVAQVDDLLAKMRDAVDELERRKAELQSQK